MKLEAVTTDSLDHITMSHKSPSQINKIEEWLKSRFQLLCSRSCDTSTGAHYTWKIRGCCAAPFVHVSRTRNHVLVLNRYLNMQRLFAWIFPPANALCPSPCASTCITKLVIRQWLDLIVHDNLALTNAHTVQVDRSLLARKTWVSWISLWFVEEN